MVTDPTNMYFSDMLKYCDFPGERLKYVDMTINGSRIDGYDHHAYVNYREFRLDKNKRIGYERAMGME